MTRKISLLALGAIALLPVFAAGTASAQGYLERDVEHDWRALHHDYAVRNYDAWRQWNAARHGNWCAADYWRWRKAQENRRIAATRADLLQDYRRLEYRGY
jgi:hypothetical protein